MSDNTLYRCPVESCEYVERERSVIGHAVGKKDDAHAGLKYQELVGQLEPAGETAEADAEGGGEAGGTNIKPEIPMADSNNSGDDSDDEPACPECGGNVYFPADNTEYEYGCAACSTEDEWVVFNS